MTGQECRQEYIRRIHKVQNYIDQHISETISVEKLANVAGFSKYHFSRLFQGILNESLAHYVNRIRMERACFLLAHRNDKNMTDIAYELGFADSATFSRAFKNYCSISPREYRKEYSKNCKESFLLSEYNKVTAKEKTKNNENLFPVTGQITTTNMTEKQVVYVRFTGTYEKLGHEYPKLFDTLFTCAAKQSIIVDEESWLLAVYHDNPEFGEEMQFRTSICLTVHDNYKIHEDGVLGIMKLEGGLYAVGHFEINQWQYKDAWNYMYHEWIMNSGYVPRDSFPFEVYRNNPMKDENHLHILDIYVPIEPIVF